MEREGEMKESFKIKGLGTFWPHSSRAAEARETPVTSTVAKCNAFHIQNVTVKNY
jgi:hypothetical protein